jgi:hypothetical protein
MTSSDYEEPLADVVEQSQPAVPGTDESDEPPTADKLPLEVDPADAAEQAIEVAIDEDDYR